MVTRQQLFSHNVLAELASGSKPVDNWIRAENSLNVLNAYLATTLASIKTTLETETDPVALSKKLQMHLNHLNRILTQAKGKLQLTTEQKNLVSSVESLVKSNDDDDNNPKVAPAA